MTIAVIDEWRTDRIAQLNDLIHHKQLILDEGYFGEAPALEAAKDERAQLCLSSEWYRDFYHAVLAITGRDASISRTKVTEDGRLYYEDIEGPEATLTRLSRTYGDLSVRLQKWVYLLQERGQLTAEDIKTLPPLQEPKHLAYIERLAREVQDRKDFEAGFERLREAIKKYAAKHEQSVPWAERDFLACWNVGRFTRDKAGLLSFAKALMHKKLLPAQWRMVTTLGELWQKVGG